jgi:hypothetical protein
MAHRQRPVEPLDKFTPSRQSNRLHAQSRLRTTDTRHTCCGLQPHMASGDHIRLSHRSMRPFGICPDDCLLVASHLYAPALLYGGTASGARGSYYRINNPTAEIREADWRRADMYNGDHFKLSRPSTSEGLVSGGRRETALNQASDRIRNRWHMCILPAQTCCVHTLSAV